MQITQQKINIICPNTLLFVRKISPDLRKKVSADTFQPSLG